MNNRYYPQVLPFIVCLTLLFCSPPPLSADEAKAETKTQIRSVALFKNGLGFFRAEATLPEKSANVVLGQLPVPSYGTFWVRYPQQVQIKQITSGLVETEEPTTVTSLNQLLPLNAGKNVAVWTDPDQEQGLNGTIMEVIKSGDNPAPSPYFMGERLPPRTNYIAPLAHSGILMLKTDQGITALTTGSIRRVDFPDDDFVSETTSKSKKASLRVQLDRPAPDRSAPLSVKA